MRKKILRDSKRNNEDNVGRLKKRKIIEYIEVRKNAKRAKKQFPNTRLWLVGIDKGWNMKNIPHYNALKRSDNTKRILKIMARD